MNLKKNVIAIFTVNNVLVYLSKVIEENFIRLKLNRISLSFYMNLTIPYTNDYQNVRNKNIDEGIAKSCFLRIWKFLDLKLLYWCKHKSAN